jgi:glycerol-3-phosphate acyltransferase PlsY
MAWWIWVLLGLALAGLEFFVGGLYLIFVGIGAIFVGLASLATWLVVALLTRYSSLAALVTAVLAPVYLYLMQGDPRGVFAVAVMSALLIWRHRANISKLMNGTESRLGNKASRPGAGQS